MKLIELFNGVVETGMEEKHLTFDRFPPIVTSIPTSHKLNSFLLNKQIESRIDTIRIFNIQNAAGDASKSFQDQFNSILLQLFEILGK